MKDLEYGISEGSDSSSLLPLYTIYSFIATPRTGISQISSNHITQAQITHSTDTDSPKIPHRLTLLKRFIVLTSYLVLLAV